MKLTNINISTCGRMLSLQFPTDRAIMLTLIHFISRTPFILAQMMWSEKEQKRQQQKPVASEPQTLHSSMTMIDIIGL